MNDERRKSIREIVGKIADARTSLQSILSEEQGAFDALPENMQQGERGQKMETAVSELEEAIESLESVETNLETASE